MEEDLITVGVMNSITIGQVTVQSNRDGTEELIEVIKKLLAEDMVKEYLSAKNSSNEFPGYTG